jgi:hypothetical protein
MNFSLSCGLQYLNPILQRQAQVENSRGVHTRYEFTFCGCAVADPIGLETSLEQTG